MRCPHWPSQALVWSHAKPSGWLHAVRRCRALGPTLSLAMANDGIGLARMIISRWAGHLRCPHWPSQAFVSGQMVSPRAGHLRCPHWPSQALVWPDGKPSGWSPAVRMLSGQMLSRWAGHLRVADAAGLCPPTSWALPALVLDAASC